jgi:uncharacterized protein YebE (UPF0316 family)
MLKKILMILVSLLIILLFSIKLNLNLKAFDAIATFLSITTGFTITALSIIATSPFSKNLYNQESKKDNSVYRCITIAQTKIDLDHSGVLNYETCHDYFKHC